MEWHPIVPNRENRVGLVVGTKVSFSPGITASSLVMGQVQGQARKQVHEVGIKSYKAGHRHGSGAAQARTHHESWNSKASPSRGGSPWTGPSQLFSQLWPKHGSWPQAWAAKVFRGGRRPQNWQMVLRALPVPCLTPKWRWIWPPGSQTHLGAWKPSSVTHKGPLELLCCIEAILRHPLFSGVVWDFPHTSLFTLPWAQTQAPPAQAFSSPSEFGYLQLSVLPAPVCQEHGVS